MIETEKNHTDVNVSRKTRPMGNNQVITIQVTEYSMIKVYIDK